MIICIIGDSNHIEVPTYTNYMKAKLKYIGLITLIGFYLFAGINHFINPEFYLPLIPPYLPNHELINWLAGIAEIVLAIGMIYPATRRISAYGIIAMLIAFLRISI